MKLILLISFHLFIFFGFSQCNTLDKKVDSVINYYSSVLDKVLNDENFNRSDSSYNIYEINNFFYKVSKIESTSQRIDIYVPNINQETYLNWINWCNQNKCTLKWEDISPYLVKDNTFFFYLPDEKRIKESINKWLNEETY